MINYETIVELNLSSNWFGVEGLYEFKEDLSRFQNLKILKLGTSKLCFSPKDDTMAAKKLGELLELFVTVEELDIQENSINDDKFVFIIDGLASLKNLKSLNLSKNPISHVTFEQFLVKLDTNLEKLIMTGCLLRDDGLKLLLEAIIVNPKLFKNLSLLGLNSNRFTGECSEALNNFIISYHWPNFLTIELRKQDIYFKYMSLFKEKLREEMK